ncbi:MAG: HD domain-containing protein [Bdellovibrionales bacterium]|nr:HD domain-containing protein [Bdellovibrionales bacterium]
MNKIFVDQLKEKETIQTCFLVNTKVLLTDKNGKPYMSCGLSDKSGSIHAMIWENAEDVDAQIEPGDIARVKGHVQKYQDRLQIIVHQMKKAASEEFDMGDFVASTGIDPALLFKELEEHINSVEKPAIQQLLLDTINDVEVKKRLFLYPAAKTIHHAKIGGLLEHIVSICGLMKVVANHYKDLNRDLLIFGAIYHDIGKLWELSIDEGFQYTTEGRLVGHMAIALELLDEKSSKIMGFTKELKVMLKHIILSHHGKLEYGSPKRPKFPEALVVAMIDDFDSKVSAMFQSIQEGSDAGEWTSYNKNFDRYLYRGVKKEIN